MCSAAQKNAASPMRRRISTIGAHPVMSRIGEIASVTSRK